MPPWSVWLQPGKRSDGFHAVAEQHQPATVRHVCAAGPERGSRETVCARSQLASGQTGGAAQVVLALDALVPAAFFRSSARDLGAGFCGPAFLGPLAGLATRRRSAYRCGRQDASGRAGRSLRAPARTAAPHGRHRPGWRTGGLACHPPDGCPDTRRGTRPEQADRYTSTQTRNLVAQQGALTP